GDGLAGAVAGVEAGVDASKAARTRREVTERIFTAANTHLRDAPAEHRGGHYVLLSIVGVDRVDLPYYAGKRRQEQLLAVGTVPWTVLRSTQVHQLDAQGLGR